MNRGRFRVVAAVLVLAALVVVARAVQIMVLQHEHWRDRALRQQSEEIEAPGPRGDIVTADGYLMATSVERWAAQVDTKWITHRELFADAAAPLVGKTPGELLEGFETGARFQWLKKELPLERAEELRRLAPDSVVLVPDSRRIYPMGTLAAQVVGFTGREELQILGRRGLERRFDDVLAGDPATYLVVKDASQRQLRLDRRKAGRPGSSLELTLHARLQAVCERELEKAVDEYDAVAASAVILDARTGEVLALASVPTVDPEDGGNVLAERWRLRPVEDAYEPGSVVKPVVAAAALAAGVVEDGERFDCRGGGIRYADLWIDDHVEPGLYTLDEVIAESANAGIVDVADRLSPAALRDAFVAFGFGRRTGIEFTAEAAGRVRETAAWTRHSPGFFALGQELTASPLQVALAYAAIANGGWLLQPRLLRWADDGRHRSNESPMRRTRVLSDDLCARLSRMLEAVVVDGTGDLARVPGYRVAGKTGTAQLLVNGRFNDEHTMAWFAGFLPLPDPRLAIVVAIEKPTVDTWGSKVAAPVFARIADAAVCYFGLPATESTGHPGRPGMTVGGLVERLPGARLVGDGAVVVRGITLDSRQVRPETVFAALPGQHAHGIEYLAEALAAGAAAVLSDRDRPDRVEVPWVVSPNPRPHAAAAAWALAGDPQQQLRLAGITGTNGKSTTAHLLSLIFSAAGTPNALFGTLSYQLPKGDRVAAERTTPEATVLAPLLRHTVDDGGRVAIIEVSSHALMQDRLAGLEFEVAVWTNLSRDHLDYHGDMESYFQAKRRLFDELLSPEGRRVLPVDEPWGARLLDDSRPGDVPWGLDRGVVTSEDAECDLEGCRFRLRLADESVPIRLPLVGVHNLRNAVAAAAAAHAAGLAAADIRGGLESARPLAGRLERVAEELPFPVFVDYAHTPGGLRTVMQALRRLSARRLIVVFGAGGDRDTGKRGPMGFAVGELADVALVTSDNPRTEDPAGIAQAVAEGVRAAGAEPVLVLDRRQAIAQALEIADEGALVVVAGKGHEATQTIGSQKLPFSDQEVVRELARRQPCG